MILIVLTVVVIAVMIATLAIFLFRIGILLNRVADDLDDCVQTVKSISFQADAIGPGVKRINETGTTVLGALPLLVDGAERVAAAKGAPYADPAAVAATSRHHRHHTPSMVPAGGASYRDNDRASMGYMDA